MESRIRPNVAPMAKRTEKIQHDAVRWRIHKALGQLESQDSILSTAPRFLANRPVFLSHRSAANEKSRNKVVTQQPAMKRGFSP